MIAKIAITIKKICFFMIVIFKCDEYSFLIDNKFMMIDFVFIHSVCIVRDDVNLSPDYASSQADSFLYS